MSIDPHRAGRALVGFHNRVARQITGNQTHRQHNRIWDYPPSGGSILETGLEEVEVNIPQRQSTVAHYIATRPIMDICEEEKQRPGLQVLKRWW